MLMYQLQNLIIDIIKNVNIYLHGFMCGYEAKKDEKNSNNLFKQQVLMHSNYVLCRCSAVEFLYRCVNRIIL